MNYRKVYQQLIAKRRGNPAGGYIEKHHIRPRSEGGGDDAGNIVSLTVREHYVAHLLLAKIYNDAKMLSAVVKMHCIKPGTDRNFRFSSRLYAALREKFSEAFSGKNAPNFGKRWWNNGSSNILSTECPVGFSAGRFFTQEKNEIRRQKLSEIGKSKKGHANNFYGRHHTDEVRALISKIHKGKTPWNKGHVGEKLSDEHKQKDREAMLGMVFWNNGIKNVRSRECPGEGWSRGKLKK